MKQINPLTLVKPTTFTPIYNLFDRSFTKQWYFKILWLLLVVLVTFAVFYAVSLNLFPNPSDFELAKDGEPQGRLLLLFRLLYDPSTVDHLTPKARAFGVIVVVVGMIIFMGMLISVASNILNSHVLKYENGHFEYQFKNHYIILGFNHSTPALVNKLLSKYHRRILILSEMPAGEIRTILDNETQGKNSDRIIIKNGQRTSIETLKNLNITEAQEIWIMGEVNEFGHDPLNLDCTRKIAEICMPDSNYQKHRIKSYADRLAVYVQFEDQSTLTAFQTTDISSNWLKDNERIIRFIANNYDDDWARKLIVTRKYDGKKGHKSPAGGEYPALDAPNGIPTTYESAKHVHLIVYGMTEMGLAVAKRTAHHIHLPNFVRDEKLKTKITFIDENAEYEMKKFRNRFSQIFEIQSSTFKDFTSDDIREVRYAPTKFKGNHADFLDVEYEFIKAESECERVRDYLDDLAKSEDTLLCIAVCHNDPNSNLNIGLNLPHSIYYPKDDKRVIPVFIRQFTCGSLVDLLNEGLFRNVYPFGMWNGCDFEGEDEYLIAKKVNRAYFDENDTEFLLKDINDDWKGQKVTDQWSSQYSADSFTIKLRCVNNDVANNIELLSNVEHNRWNMAQLLSGFHLDESLPVDSKDKVKLLHSCIIPYKQLSENSKNKDRYIVRRITDMINK